MFYPNIFRRKAYTTKNNDRYYTNYEHYRSEITEDCDQRCVYCDITQFEHGGEGMQLDHFKPQRYFEDLVSDPNNLVLACPKCNRLKHDYWPVNADIGLDGFLDPFTPNRINWYQINPSGTVESKNSHATALKIKKLLLNRPARVQIRRRRLIEKRITNVDEVLNKKLCELNFIIANNDIDSSSKLELLKDIRSLKEKIDILRKL